MNCFDDCRRDGEDAYRFHKHDYDTQDRLREGRYEMTGDCNRDFYEGYKAAERRDEDRRAEERQEEERCARQREQHRVDEQEHWDQIYAQQEQEEQEQRHEEANQVEATEGKEPNNE